MAHGVHVLHTPPRIDRYWRPMPAKLAVPTSLHTHPPPSTHTHTACPSPIHPCSAFVEDVAESDGGGGSDESEDDGSDDLSGFITTTTGAEETPGHTDR
jgi:hypothetical protein